MPYAIGPLGYRGSPVFLPRQDSKAGGSQHLLVVRKEASYMALLSQVVSKVGSRKLLSTAASIAGLVVFNLRLAEIDPSLLDNPSVLLVNGAIAGLGGFNTYRQAKVDEVEAENSRVHNLFASPGMSPPTYKMVDKTPPPPPDAGPPPPTKNGEDITMPPEGDPPAGQ